jgi:hypothetical protein
MGLNAYSHDEFEVQEQLAIIDMHLLKGQLHNMPAGIQAFCFSEQKRDIVYNNATRFLRLKDSYFRPILYSVFDLSIQ